MHFVILPDVVRVHLGAYILIQEEFLDARIGIFTDETAVSVTR